jgi:hypothetical protein
VAAVLIAILLHSFCAQWPVQEQQLCPSCRHRAKILLLFSRAKLFVKNHGMHAAIVHTGQTSDNLLHQLLETPSAEHCSG